MATKSQRVFALFGAILFLVTSSALTIAYVVSNIETSKQSSNNSSPTSSQTAAALAKAEAENKAKTASQTSKTSSSTSTTKSTKLAGTIMQDFTPVSDVTKLEATDLTVGSGETVKSGATVTVDYTGAVASTGIIFQSSLDSGQPVTFSLNQVIPGWTDGVPGMKVGGTRRLLIPANLAYGANPPAGSGIPANAALVFDITLHAITSN